MDDVDSEDLLQENEDNLQMRLSKRVKWAGQGYFHHILLNIFFADCPNSHEGLKVVFEESGTKGVH